jgi:uncharacterized protein YaaR (DUF327 family)
MAGDYIHLRAKPLYNPSVSRINPLGGAAKGATGAKKAAAGRKADDATAKGAGGVPANILPLIKEIEDTGEELMRDPTGHALERYRRSVQRLLDTAVAESVRVNSESSLGLSQKVFSTVTKINMALAELTDAVLGRQQDLLKARAIIDQIKGLVVDCYR